MAAYDIPAAVHRAVLAGTDRIPTPRAQEGEVSETVRDDREPKQCPVCGVTCVYDGWDHVHPNGIGIGSCTPDLSSAERSVVDRIEQAPDAPEALREKVAEAIHDGDGSRCRHGWLDCPQAPKYRRMADAAIGAIRGAR